MPEGMPAQADRAQAQAAAETATASETATADEATDADAAAGTDDAAAETESDSFKALKAGTDLAVEGGSFAIDSADDAFHANGGLTVGGGSFTVATGDDGFHADEDLLIEGQPVIDITTCYEGLEGGNVTVNSGDITINATDDGVNAAGGSGNGAAAAGAFGPDQFAGGGDYTITINGGSLRVTAAFDGLDSNGDIWITGGEVAVSAAGTEALGGDGAIDCDGSFAITGGTLAAAGGSAFVVMGSGGASINAGGSQPVLNFQFTDEQPAKTTIALQDESGNTLVSYTADKAFKTVALSSPELQSGESYTVTADGEAVYTVTLSGNLTSISDTGASVDTAMGPGAGGMGGRGGTGL